MKIENAQAVSIVYEKISRYEQAMESMKSGYDDEWELKNKYTGTVIKLSVDDWEEINTMFFRELETAKELLESF